MEKRLCIPGSVGELLDKVSILNIKRVMINDVSKLVIVKKEILIMSELAQPYLKNKEVEDLYDLLLMVNRNLWEVEDILRKFEAYEKFDEEFVAKARSVYMLNDRRHELKNKIDSLLHSDIFEVKEYVNY
jgi:hypothetical protein